jgi:hypothetical protein
MPYQILTRQNSGTYSTLVGSAAKALAKLDELQSAGHTDVLVRDLDGNDVHWTSLTVEALRASGEPANDRPVGTRAQAQAA